MCGWRNVAGQSYVAGASLPRQMAAFRSDADRFPGVFAKLRHYLAQHMVDVEKIRAMAERAATSEGLTLVDVELKGGRSNPLLRIYIDKPAGVSHGDCQLVSEQLSALLDVEDPFPGKYLLEVSSPGLDRKLSKPSDFTHFAGRRARVVVREPVENQKIFEGRLAGFESGRVRLDLGERGLRELDLANIQKAQLVVEL
jgi:ribosome maturation factor RimP